MKSIAANIILFLFPFVFFIISFFLTAEKLEREIQVFDISSRFAKIINEAEVYKLRLKEYIKYKLSEKPNETEITFVGYYNIFEIKILGKEHNRILFEVEIKPKEEIPGSDLLIHYIDEVEV